MLDLDYPSLCRLRFSFPVARADETQASEEQVEGNLPPANEESSSDEASPEQPSAAPVATTTSLGPETPDLGVSSLSLLVDDFTGAAHLKYPIAVPPGRKNIAPDLSLTYNSHKSNGWVGVGWSLEVGVIGRSTKYGVNYLADDYVAVINGSDSELVQRNDWGQNYFGSKIEGTFSRYYHDFNPGPPYTDNGWVVTSKDGTRYFYGTTSASRQELDSDWRTMIFKWCLDRVQDTNGNFMTLTYWKDQGEIYLARIDYTGNGSLSPTNYVKFYLESRTDVSSMYTTNALVKTAYRLKTVETYSNGSLQRKYVLNYGNPSGSTGRSLLRTLTVYGNDGISALPDIGFGWTEAAGFVDQGAWITGKYENWRTAADRIRMADVNGDGKADVTLGPEGITGKWYVMLSTGSSFGDQGAWATGKYAIWNDSASRIHMADVNGDGKADVILGPEGITGKWYVMLSTGSSFADQGAWATGKYATWNDSANRIHLADVNGDGKADVILGPDVYGKWYVMLSTGSSFADQGAWITGKYANWRTAADRIRIADVNGDGRADVILGPQTNTGNWYVMLSTGASFADQGAWITGKYANWDAYWQRIRNVDVNGDGKADIVLGPQRNNGSWYVMLSTGSNFADQGAWITGAYGNWDTEWQRISNADVNGDGKADIILGPQTNTGNWYVMLSRGSSFADQGAWITGAYENWDLSSSRIRMADVKGDGRAEVILGPQINTGNWYVIAPDGLSPDLINTVSNGIGGTYTINYAPSSAYNNTLLPFVVQTVSSTSTDDGRGNISTTTYTYSGGYFSYASREFRGFADVKATDPVGTTKESWFYQDDIYKGLLYKQEVRDSYTNLHTRTDNTYNKKSPPPYQGVEYPYLERKDDYICDGQPFPSCMHLQTNFAYDSYGNTTQRKLEGDMALEGDERYEYAEYTECNSAKWIVNRPSKTWVTDKNGAKKAQTDFEYDTGCEKGNLTKKTDWLDGGTNPFTQYGYDAYGNQTSITDPKGNTTTIEYETTAYTYPFRTTIPYLNFTTEKTYNYGYGKVLTEKDYNGNITTYTYDEFGRKKTVTKPPDTTSYPTEVYSYLNFGTLGNPNPDLNQMVRVLLRKDANTSNQTWKETHFDGLGRTYLTRRENAPGNSICTQTGYNIRGLVDGRSYPYFESSQYSYWTYFDYDAVARVTTTTTFNEAGTPITTTTTYDREFTTTIDANKHAKVKEKDGLGRLIQVGEYSGTGTPQDPYELYATTNYQYDPMGNLVKVIDAAGNQTTMVYDTLSRKIKMTDPDMCSSQDPNACYWIYQYDANGNLTSQTDAKSQTILFSFFNPAIGRDDPLNRVMKKDYPTGTDIVYNYDQAGYDNPKGRLTSVTDSSGMTEYFYDERGKKKKIIQTVDAVGYTIESTFDSLDRIKSIKYPDLEIVSYTYDTAGNLSSVSGAANYVYVNYPNYNAQGQPTSVQYGNGVTTAYGYSPYTNRLTSIQTSGPGQTLQNLSYLYDNVGNVLTITDAIDPTRTQQFLYDHLNRLTWADSPAYPSRPITYQYNQIGNMDLNSQVGSYSYPIGYPLPHPHAVSQAGSNSYTYDNNGNMITGAGRLIDYDYDNRPINITQGGVTSFIYDYQGQRVKKATTVYIGKLYEITGGVYTKYIFALNPIRTATKVQQNKDAAQEEPKGQANSVNPQNIFEGGRRIASKDATGTFYYHKDRLGSSNVVTGSGGTNVEEIYYFPYGATRINSGSVNMKHKYTGQEEDGETGLYYYGARYYDPLLARFITPDTITPDYEDPQTLNRYSYVRNNPLFYTDPTGRQSNPYEGIPEWYFAPSQIPLKDWIYIVGGAGGGFLKFGSWEVGTYYFVDPKTTTYYQFMYGSGGVGVSTRKAYAAQVEGGFCRAPEDPTVMTSVSLTISGFVAWGKGYSAQWWTTGNWGYGESGSSTGVAGGKGASIAGMLTYSYYVGSGNVLPPEYQKMFEDLLKALQPSASLEENAPGGLVIIEGDGGGGE